MQLSTVLRTHAILLWLLAAHYSAEAAEMHQRSHAKVASGVVRLGDVVSVRGDAQASSILKLELCPAPAADKSLRIDRQDLLQLLLLNDIELREWKFAGAEETIIVQQKAGDVAATAATEEVPVPAVAKTASPAKAFAPAKAATAEPEANVIRVVSAIRPLNKGEIIKPSDVELIPAKDEKTAVRSFQNLEEVVGKEARRLIPAGFPLDSSYVQRQQLVKRGEHVTIRAKAAGVTVTVSGVVKDDGAAGEVVSVVPEGSKDVILARVTGLRELEIFASGPRY